mgnify:CR=1 FL=1
MDGGRQVCMAWHAHRPKDFFLANKVVGKIHPKVARVANPIAVFADELGAAHLLPAPEGVDRAEGGVPALVAVTGHLDQVDSSLITVAMLNDEHVELAGLQQLEA